ncbi:MAG TPA: hypothetical protein VEH05_11410 [Streptosporangiaceae bacterium]|nr:hypothetical protein [Streptosporangiaceae bacterium]
MAGYCRGVVAVLALTGAALFIVAGLGVAARIVHIGNLDALGLAAKLATPYPASPADWPELAVRAVVQQPDEPATVLLLVDRPHHDTPAVTLLLELSGPPERSMRLLESWCQASSSISPSLRGDAEIELRRRQSLERVRGRLLTEDSSPARAAARS